MLRSKILSLKTGTKFWKRAAVTASVCQYLLVTLSIHNGKKLTLLVIKSLKMRLSL